jgi:hypothetical protein
LEATAVQNLEATAVQHLEATAVQNLEATAVQIVAELICEIFMGTYLWNTVPS